ncbi:MAG: hypothetical protein WBX14_09115 [Candidatus Udaeobacter sp.]
MTEYIDSDTAPTMSRHLTASLANFTAVLLVTTVIAGDPKDISASDNEIPSPDNALADYFRNWFSRVTKIQEAQPHWVTPLVTVTPRLEEELRYDQFWESLTGGHTLINYGGGGGKGVELIPFNPVEVIIGIPSWQTVNTEPPKKGWTDESFLVKYRLLAANEKNGDYIVTAFMGLTVPNGSNPISTHHFAYSPTVAVGKGFGDFDVQSTVGVSVPENGGSRVGAGTPILFNTAFQYHVLKYLWPEVETNYTYWPNGEHRDLSQLFITPGLVIGRIPIAGRVGLTVAAGCQVAVTNDPLYHRNVILSARLPF